MEENTIFTLREFIDIFGGIDQIHSIFVDTDDDQIRLMLQGSPRPLDILHNYNNIMVDDEYLVLSNGDYVLNKEKVFEAYGDYFVSLYFPVIPPEYVQEANALVHTTTEREYLSRIAQYSNGVEILIKKSLDFNIRFERALNPNVNSSINGLAIFNYYETPEEAYNGFNGVPPVITEFVAIVESESEMLDVIKQRITMESVVYEIKNGKISSDNFRIFVTDKDGRIEEIMEGEEEENHD